MLFVSFVVKFSVCSSPRTRAYAIRPYKADLFFAFFAFFAANLLACDFPQFSRAHKIFESNARQRIIGRFADIRKRLADRLGAIDD